eukprot:363873-Chlamydomonas_euryale.AAC.3
MKGSRTGDRQACGRADPHRHASSTCRAALPSPSPAWPPWCAAEPTGRPTRSSRFQGRPWHCARRRRTHGQVKGRRGRVCVHASKARGQERPPPLTKPGLSSPQSIAARHVAQHGLIRSAFTFVIAATTETRLPRSTP